MKAAALRTATVLSTATKPTGEEEKLKIEVTKFTRFSPPRRRVAQSG